MEGVSQPERMVIPTSAGAALIVNACACVGRVPRVLSIARAGHCQVDVSDAGALNYGADR